MLTAVPWPFLSFHAHTSIHTEKVQIGSSLVFLVLPPLLGGLNWIVCFSALHFCFNPKIPGIYLYACALRVSFIYHLLH